ncbi:mhck ef2 kinase domain family protein [Ichthyophthirius multifiliis]|uniref:Mhck ef2 kinase domain family protein n=1 Tax=Ichthyophthirius multifiliis TaxID=5932 RepID=G0QVQ8_ICHMU|nr:mhck ef2 kinase domain family protein [Ichthyophthirius multifiliis]EGR30702.1 mhck ef2 kinase domain family protein [Ichthyophthirius multifiliis]|eukprot:XP_004032289.1 mhck ef2 kinase domain family protein [Ichthyophthirius multifiliis]
MFQQHFRRFKSFIRVLIKKRKSKKKKEFKEETKSLIIKRRLQKYLNIAQNIRQKKQQIHEEPDSQIINHNQKVDQDLLFSMDCTDSMRNYINMCRTELYLINENIKQQFKNSTLRIRFLGFRDFEDENNLENYEFTNEYDKLKNFINKIHAVGGQDKAENIAGAFQQALQLDCKSKYRYAVLIADAYPHGQKYSKRQNKDRIIISLNLKKNIIFNRLNISFILNQMYDIFLKLFQDKRERIYNFQNQIMKVEQSEISKKIPSQRLFRLQSLILSLRLQL